MHLDRTAKLRPVSSVSCEPGLCLTPVEVINLQSNGLRHLGFEITSPVRSDAVTVSQSPPGGKARVRWSRSESRCSRARCER